MSRGGRGKVWLQHPHCLILQQLLSQQMNHANDTTRTHLRPLAADHMGGTPRAIALLPHAALTPPLIHHCLLLFPHRICRGRHFWPRGKWIETATGLRFPHLHIAKLCFVILFFICKSLHRPRGESSRVLSCLEALYTEELQNKASWWPAQAF